MHMLIAENSSRVIIAMLLFLPGSQLTASFFDYGHSCLGPYSKLYSLSPFSAQIYSSSSVRLDVCHQQNT